MAVWTVFEPEEDTASTEWAERVTLVRDRFSWSSLLFAPLVLLRHGLWLAFLAYIVVQGAIGFAILYFDLDDAALALLAFANLVVAFELPGLRRAKLEGRGFEEVGIVIAPTLEAAEQRYFDTHDGAVPSRSRPLPMSVLGLFPEAVGR
jgi:hypothetical protein